MGPPGSGSPESNLVQETSALCKAIDVNTRKILAVSLAQNRSGNQSKYSDFPPPKTTKSLCQFMSRFWALMTRFSQLHAREI